MIKRVIRMVVITGMILISACGDKQSDGIKLRLNYPEGFEQVIISEIITKGSFTSDLENIIELKLKLDSVINHETYLFTARFLRMRSKMVSSAGTETYDSDKESSFPAIDRVLRSPLTIQINRRGMIVQPFQFAGSQENAASLIDMSIIQIVFPEREVKVGDTWKNESTSSGGVTKRTFELKEVTDSEVKIAVTGSIKDAMGRTFSKKLKGEYRLDRKSNRLLEGKLESDLPAGGRFVYKIYVK